MLRTKRRGGQGTEKGDHVTSSDTPNDTSGLDFGILRDDVGFQVHITQRAIWQALRRRRLKNVPREPSGYHASMVLIGQNPGISQKDLAEALVIDAPNVTIILSRMEQAGLVERRQDPNDRRKALLTLTEAGEVRLRQALAFNQTQRQLFGRGLSDEESLQLAHLLRKLQHALRNGGSEAAD